MKSKLFFVLLLLSLSFAIYPFNITIIGNTTINTSSMEFPDSLFYSNGNLYITDPIVGAIFVWDGENFKKITSFFASPKGIYVDKAGRMYVADSSSVIKYYDASFNTLYTDTVPYGVFLYNNTVYFVDQKYDHIYKIKTDGTFVDYFADKGLYNGKINNAYDIFIHNNTIYVADTGNDRIESFYMNGSYKSTYGGLGGLKLDKPIGLFVDDYYVYVADYNLDKVIIYTKDGYPVFAYNITYPRDVYVNDGIIYISQSDTGKVFLGNISLVDPKEFVGNYLNERSNEILDYIILEELADKLGINYEPIKSRYENIKFSYKVGNYGEAYYNLKELSFNKTELEDNVKRTLEDMTDNETILELIENGKYNEAYNLIEKSKKSGEGKKEEKNTTKNETKKENVTKENNSEYYHYLNYINLLKKECSLYKVNVSFEDIDSAMNDFDNKKDEINTTLSFIIEKLNDKKYSINLANASIQSLEKEINKKEFLIDYTKAKEYLTKAKSVLYNDPELAGHYASEGKNAIDDAKGFRLTLLIILSIVLVIGGIAIYYHFVGKRRY